jgi:hypothetical protein
MPLQEEIDKTRQEIRTDGYSMSIGEWISLYENNEIDIHPEFQRFYSLFYFTRNYILAFLKR